MAQAVVQKLLTDAGLGKQFKLDSAGTQANHAGEKPDPRALSALKRRGYDASRLRSRKVAAKDFEHQVEQRNQDRRQQCQPGLQAEHDDDRPRDGDEKGHDGERRAAHEAADDIDIVREQRQ